jgi:hypothetical protein
VTLNDDDDVSFRLPTQKKMGEKRSSLHDSVPNTLKKKFRVLKHQYFLGFVWKRRFFFIERVPDTVQKRRYKSISLLCFFVRSNEEEEEEEDL